MNKRLLFYIIILIIAIWVGLIIIADPGYVLFSFHHWTIEMPFWLCVVLVIAIVWIVSALWSLCFNTFHQRGKLRSWHSHRKIHKGHSISSEGLLALKKGKWKSAENLLIQGTKTSKMPIINYLSAARAAQELGSIERRDQYLSAAEKNSPREKLAIGLTQAELQFENSEHKKALETLLKLQKIAPRNRHVLKLLKRTYIAVKDWQSLSALLPTLRNEKVLDESRIEKLELKIHEENLNTENLDKKAIKKTWQTLHPEAQKSVSLVGTHIKALLKSKEDDEAAEMLVKHLKQDWSDELIYLLGEAKTSNPDKQMKQAESFIKHNKDSAALLNTLGKLAIRARLWAKGKEYLQQSLQKEPSAWAYIELGLIYHELNEPVKSQDAFRQGAKLLS